MSAARDYKVTFVPTWLVVVADIRVSAITCASQAALKALDSLITVQRAARTGQHMNLDLMHDSVRRLNMDVRAVTQPIDRMPRRDESHEQMDVWQITQLSIIHVAGELPSH